MGIRHLSAAMYDHVGLPPTAKLVLIAIADHINDETGYGWPSFARLASITNIHRTNVVKWIHWLEDNGHIVVGRKAGCPNRYRLTSSASATGSGGTTSSASATGVVAPAHKTSSASATRTRRTRNNQASGVQTPPTPTPPPVDAVLKHLEQYR